MSYPGFIRILIETWLQVGVVYTELHSHWLKLLMASQQNLQEVTVLEKLCVN